MRNYYIPLRTQETIDRYVSSGCPTGSFMQAVISNDLKEACGRADVDNAAALFEIVKYLYNNVPADCWGTPERYKKWIDSRGVKGKEVIRNE